MITSKELSERAVVLAALDELWARLVAEPGPGSETFETLARFRDDVSSGAWYVLDVPPKGDNPVDMTRGLLSETDNPPPRVTVQCDRVIREPRDGGWRRYLCRLNAGHAGRCKKVGES